MKDFTKANVTTLRDDIQKALDKIGKKHGVTCKLKAGRYDDVTYTATMQAVLGTSDDAGKNLWKKHYQKFGLKLDDFGKKVTLQGKTFTVNGIAPRSRKYPVLAKRSDGKVFKLTVESVRMAS